MARSFFSLVFRPRGRVAVWRPKHQATELGLPLIERRVAELAAHIGRLRSGFLLPQDAR
jgi:hypothetical protein